MTTRHTHGGATRRLYGPTVQYPDGKVVRGRVVNVERILTEFEQLDANSRSAFLCIVAHHLTVAIRCIVFDPPVTEGGLERVKWINETLHRLTSCVNPHRRWSPHDEGLLIREIIENSFMHGFDGWIGHALAAAAGNTLSAKKPVAAK